MSPAAAVVARDVAPQCTHSPAGVCSAVVPPLQRGVWSEQLWFRGPSAGGTSTAAGVVRIAVFGDMGVSAPAEELLASIVPQVRGGLIDAVLHLGDFGYNLPDPLNRNWDIKEPWYMEHKQR